MIVLPVGQENDRSVRPSHNPDATYGETLNGEDLLVGLICLSLVPLIASRILRGLRTGRVPVYRTYIDRDVDRTKFTVLLIVHALSRALVAVIAADLLLALGFRS